MPKKEAYDSWDDLSFFTRKGAKIGNPKITITNKHSVLFNSAFCHKANLAGKTRVRLGYSQSKKAVIFDFTEDQEAEGAFALVFRGSTAFTTCRSFFNAHELDAVQISGHYIPHKERIPRIGEIWFIRLGEREIMK